MRDLREFPRSLQQDFHFIDQGNLSDLIRALKDFNFRVHIIDGTRIHDEVTFFQESGKGLEFADEGSFTWEAFVDSLGKFSSPSKRWAIIWTSCSQSASQALPTFFQGAFWLATFRREVRSVSCLGLFFVGTGDSFDPFVWDPGAIVRRDEPKS